jgi:hypothetical protein
MAPRNDLLSTIQGEIEARLADLRPLRAEYEQLLAAMQALDAGDASRAQATAPSIERGGRQRKSAVRGSAAGAIGRAASKPRRTRASTGAGRKSRAGRGAAREAILSALEHGSHTVSELVTVTAMSTPNISGNVRRLLAEGKISKTDRGGRAAYVLDSSGQDA